MVGLRTVLKKRNKEKKEKEKIEKLGSIGTIGQEAVVQPEQSWREKTNPLLAIAKLFGRLVQNILINLVDGLAGIVQILLISGVVVVLILIVTQGENFDAGRVLDGVVQWFKNGFILKN